MSNVYIYGYYGYGNLGDELLAQSVFEGLKYKYDKFYFRSFDRIEFLKDSNRIISTQSEKILNNGNSKVKSLLSYLNFHWNIFGDCKAFYFGGGTTIAGLQSSKTLFITILLLLIAKVRGLDTIAIGVGVTDGKNILKKMLLFLIFRLVNSVRVRDLDSLKVVNRYKMKNTMLTSDLVFSLMTKKVAEKKNRYRKNDNKKIAIVTVAAPHVAESNSTNIIIEKYREIIDNLVREGYKVNLFPFQVLDQNYDDLDFFNKIKNSYFGKNDDVYISNNKLDNVYNFYNEADLVIGHRFHSLILAIIHRIPFVGIFHEHKVSALTNEMNYPLIRFNDLKSLNVTKFFHEYKVYSLVSSNKEIDFQKLSENNFDDL